jgi:antirestriction protein ArdC
MKRDIYQEITDRIINNVDEAGKWRPCWQGMNGSFPTNAHTDAHYRGANVLNLWLSAGINGYQSGKWASYKQWQKMGYPVRKGERGTLVVFYKQIKSTDPEDKGYTLLRYSHVFNADQVTDYVEDVEFEPTPKERIARCEHLFGHIGIEASIRHSDEGRAYFNIRGDYVMMPRFNQFNTAENYYSVLAHELTHWTGHKSRLDREFAHRGLDKETYAKEELVAEIGAAFLCAQLGIDNITREDHESYIKSWLKALKNDKSLIITAASKASAAVDYLLGVAEQNTVPIEEVA